MEVRPGDIQVLHAGKVNAPEMQKEYTGTLKELVLPGIGQAVIN
jgi:hypothetical protein